MIDDTKLYGYVGAQLKTLRTENKMTQAEVAKAMQLTRTSIINFEKGVQKISISSLYEYCQHLGVSVSSVLPSMEVVSAERSSAANSAVKKLGESPVTRAALEKILREK